MAGHSSSLIVKRRRFLWGILIAAGLIAAVALFIEVSQSWALQSARRQADSVELAFEPGAAVKRLPDSLPKHPSVNVLMRDALKAYSDSGYREWGNELIESGRQIAAIPVSATVGEASGALLTGSEDAAATATLAQIIVSEGLRFADEDRYQEAFECAVIADRLREQHLTYPAPMIAQRDAYLYGLVSKLLAQVLAGEQNSDLMRERIREFQQKRVEPISLADYMNCLTAAGVMSIRDSGEPRESVAAEGIWPAEYMLSDRWQISTAPPGGVAAFISNLRHRMGVGHVHSHRLRVRDAETRLLMVGVAIKRHLSGISVPNALDYGAAITMTYDYSSSTALEATYVDQLDKYRISYAFAVGSGRLLLAAVEVIEGEGSAAPSKEPHWFDPMTGRPFEVGYRGDSFWISSWADASRKPPPGNPGAAFNEDLTQDKLSALYMKLKKS